MSKKENNGTLPNLRFPEFKNSRKWNIKKLGDLTYKVDKKNKNGIKYPIYSINNIKGFVPQSEQFEGVDSNDRGYDISLYKIIERDTFAYNPARINVGSIGFSGVLHNIIISSLYVCFKTHDELNDTFLQYFLETNTFNESVKNNVEGGIRNYLFYENFSRIKICIPDILEQQKIASCLSFIDNLITAQGQKLEALKAHKKGLMQQLFPSEGETVPKLRFKEFEGTGNWCRKKLGQIAIFSKGKGISKSDISLNGVLPCIRYGELYTHYNETIKTIKSYTNIPANELILSQANDVIIPASGETHEDIATASCVLEGGIALGGDLNIIRSEINGVFLSYYLNNAKKQILLN